MRVNGNEAEFILVKAGAAGESTLNDPIGLSYVDPALGRWLSTLHNRDSALAYSESGCSCQGLSRLSTIGQDQRGLCSWAEVRQKLP